MANSQLKFAEVKENNIVNQALDTFQRAHPSLIERKKRLEYLIEQLKSNNQIDKNERIFLLACAYNVLSQAVFLEDQDNGKPKIWQFTTLPLNERMELGKQVASYIKMLDSQFKPEAFFIKYKFDVKNFNFIYNIGGVCPNLIVNYIESEKLDSHQVGLICNAFAFYQPQFKNILNCLKKHCSNKILIENVFTCSIFNIEMQHYDICFLNDFLEVFSDTDDEPFFRKLRIILEKILSHISNLTESKNDKTTTSRQNNYATVISSVENYLAFLSKLLNLARLHPNLFRTVHFTTFYEPLQNKEAFCRHIKDLQSYLLRLSPEQSTPKIQMGKRV